MALSNALSLQEIDQIREKGLRPQVVGCFLYQKKILMVYKKKYKLWQIPQGGVDNQENLEQALIREMKEELSKIFVEASVITNIIGEDKIEFLPKKFGTKELKNDQGKNILMKGKKYFFITLAVNNPDLELQKTEFDDYRWLNYSQAKKIADKIYQPGKKRITLKILKLLKESQLL